MKQLSNSQKLYRILLCTGLLVLGLSLYFYGYEKTWKLWNIPAFASPFLDFQLLPASAESLRAGYNPESSNPFDPQERIFNYPKIWYLVLYSGINQRWTIPLAVLFITLFFVSLIFFPKQLTLLSTFLLLFGIFSPAVILGIERANVDIIFFSCMALALSLSNKSLLKSYLVLLVSILFKLFPLFGSGFFLGYERKKALKYLFAATLFTIFYFVIDYKDMLHVFSTTTKGSYLSYGWLILPTYLYIESGQMMMLKKFNFLFFVILIVIGLSMVTSAIIQRRAENNYPYNSSNLRAFWLGAGIYIGTFLLGNNWDYRLMFLLFVIPQLADWTRQRKWNLTFLVTLVTIIATSFTLWSTLIYIPLQPLFTYKAEQKTFILDESFNWLLFTGLVYLYVYSIPEWIITDISDLGKKLRFRKNLYKPIMDKKKSPVFPR